MSAVLFSSISERFAKGLATAVASFALGFGLIQWFRHRKSHQIDVEVMTYADVITYFVESRPNDEQIRSGALLRQRHRSSWVLSFVFLNSQGSICTGPDGTNYGQKLWVGTLDEEMTELFADKDLLVLE